DLRFVAGIVAGDDLDLVGIVAVRIPGQIKVRRLDEGRLTGVLVDGKLVHVGAAGDGVGHDTVGIGIGGFGNVDNVAIVLWDRDRSVGRQLRRLIVLVLKKDRDTKL